MSPARSPFTARIPRTVPTPAAAAVFALLAASAGAQGIETPATMPPPAAQAPAPANPAALEAVTVTATREQAKLSETPMSVGTIGTAAIRRTAPAHPQQLLGQVPGVAVAVTNGEGHATAIRQPFTTSPVYLFLEDGIPIRSTGFFNHNALYEIDLPQAGGVEIIRGPGSALYGSDAVGGIVNVLTREPSRKSEARLAAEAGSFGWQRLLGSASGPLGERDGVTADLNLTRTDGWRDRTAYDRQSLRLRWDRELDADSTLRTVLSHGRIDQQTGANSPLPRADYVNDPRRNNFGIAFREVEATRLSTTYERAFGRGLLSLTPYVRDNAMDLLASFTLSFDPTLARTRNQSYGLLAKWRQNVAGAWRARVIAGVDVDVSPGSRTEDRLDVASTGSGASRVFRSYTVAGRAYDYDVTFRGVSPYLHAEASPVQRLRVTAGLRHDTLEYDFDNHLPAGAVQPAAGVFYGQAGDTTVRFSRLSPKLGATWAIDRAHHLYASLNRGFRAPSESQLFRPSVSTNAADAASRAALALSLRPIVADQAEIGVRGELAGVRYDLAAYRLVKRDDIVSQRDLATNVTTSVNAGRTEHQGVELGLGAPLGRTVRVDAALSYARHTYDDWVSAQGNFSGKEIEAAPRVLANVRVGWQPSADTWLQLEWVHIGSYWLEASNASTFPKYPGHHLFNLRVSQALTRSVSLFGRVTNLADRRHAESAQVSSSTPVYAPGLPRTLFAGLEARW